MRTTISLDPDVQAAVEKLRERSGIGLSEAVNQIARRGLARKKVTPIYVPPSYPMSIKVDVANIGDVLELLDD